MIELGALFMALRYLASFADNKVTDIAPMKLMNAAQMLPVVAYFLPMPGQLLIGALPSDWPMKVLWLPAAGASPR